MLRNIILLTFAICSGISAMAQSGSDKNQPADSLYQQFEGGEENFSKSTRSQDLIHPNPTEGVFHITSIDKGDDISVFDGSGRMVFNTTGEGTKMKIDITHLDKGVYLVIVRDPNKRLKVNQKLMIK